MQRRTAKQKYLFEKKNLTWGKSFVHFSRAPVPFATQLCLHRMSECYSRAALIANATGRAFQRKSKESIAWPNFKAARSVFNKEEVDYDNDSDW